MTHEFRDPGICGLTPRSGIPATGRLHASLTRRTGTLTLVARLCENIFLRVCRGRLAGFVREAHALTVPALPAPAKLVGVDDAGSSATAAGVVHGYFSTVTIEAGELRVFGGPL